MAAMFKPDLKELALRLVKEGPVKTLPTPRRIRILYNGVYVADTVKASFVWEHPYFPQYYLPRGAFDSTKIQEGDKVQSDSGEHVATLWKIKVGDRSTDQVVCFGDDLQGQARELSGLVKANFSDMDQWFEEDTPIFVHPKDPYKRVDIVASTRPLKVIVGGQTVAVATTSMHLYETGLPVRYYLPLTSIDQSVLQPSNSKTQCPYKGEAEYYNVAVDGKEHKDIVWFYNRPTIECAQVTGLCCFYNEKVEIQQQYDGKWEKLEIPVTKWS